MVRLFFCIAGLIDLDIRDLFITFAFTIQHFNIMLGIESTHKPLKGQFAKELREALHRARTGNLNQEEKEGVLRSEKASKKYNAIWK